MYFAWQLLNILAIVIIVIYAIKFILNFKKHKLKSISYLAVTLGLLIVSNLIKEKQDKQIFILKVVPETIEDKFSETPINVNLIDAFTFDLEVNVTTLLTNRGAIPTSGVFELTGFSAGFDWDLLYFTTEKKGNGIVNYKVIGNLDWKILGIPIYTESEKEIEGTFIIEE